MALSLQADGWYLRQDIIWAKGCSFGYTGGSVMPESVTDRCTKAHEYVFLLAKSPRYFWDAQAIAEPASNDSGWAKQRSLGVNTWEYNNTAERIENTGQRIESSTLGGATRNPRDVWVIGTQANKLAHFAMMPEKLAEKCILAGTSEKADALSVARLGSEWWSARLWLLPSRGAARRWVSTAGRQQAARWYHQLRASPWAGTLAATATKRRFRVSCLICSPALAQRLSSPRS
jgi:hypothetical protein